MTGKLFWGKLCVRFIKKNKKKQQQLLSEWSIYGLWMRVYQCPFSVPIASPLMFAVLILSDLESFLLHFHPLSKWCLFLSSIYLPPSHFALASGVLLVMESRISFGELLPLMRLLSHTPYQINRLHQTITTHTHQPGPGQTQRLTSLHPRSHCVIDKMGCEQSE